METRTFRFDDASKFCGALELAQKEEILEETRIDYGSRVMEVPRRYGCFGIDTPRGRLVAHLAVNAQEQVGGEF